jgi:hypothetical protein
MNSSRCLTRPALEGAAEVSALGKTQQVGDFGNTAVGFAQVLYRQHLACVFQQVFETCLFFFQLTLQAARIHFQRLGNVSLPGNAVRQLLDDLQAHLHGDAGTVKPRQVVHHGLIIDAGEFRVGRRQGLVDQFVVKAQPVDRCIVFNRGAEHVGKLILARWWGPLQCHMHGQYWLRSRDLAHAQKDSHAHVRYNLGNAGEYVGYGYNQVSGIRLDFHVKLPGRIHKAGVTHQAIQGIPQGITGQPGQAQAVQHGGLELSGSEQTYTGIAACLNGQVQQLFYSLSRDACVGVAGARQIDAGLTKQGFRVNVAAVQRFGQQACHTAEGGDFRCRVRHLLALVLGDKVWIFSDYGNNNMPYPD